MLELRDGDKIVFTYFNPKNGMFEKQKGSVRNKTKYGYGYIVKFEKENDTYIDDDKIHKLMHHNYYVNQDNFVKFIERG